MAECFKFGTLAEQTTCPICKDVFTTPKMLQCQHVFCLTCIQRYTAGKRIGALVSCPVCQLPFTIPQGGSANLPDNTFIKKIVDLTISKLEEEKIQQLRRCDFCAEEEDGNDIQEAKWNCVTCKKQLCNYCQINHKRMRSTNNHKIEEIDLKIEREEDGLEEIKKSDCKIHPHYFIDRSCDDCSARDSTRCPWCVIIANKLPHKSTCKAIIHTSQQFRSQLETHKTKLESCIDRDNRQLQNLEGERKEFIVNGDAAEREIIEKTEEFKRFIDQHSKELLNELKSTRCSTLREMRNSKDEILAQRIKLGNQKFRCEQLKANANPLEVCWYSDNMISACEELLDSYHDDIASCNHVAFAGANVNDLLIGERTNVVGKIDVSEYFTDSGYYLTPQLIHKGDDFKIVPIDSEYYLAPKSIHKGYDSNSGNEIPGITVLLHKLYVVRTEEVTAYNLTTFVVESKLPVPGLKSPVHMASCSHYNCLYISDSGSYKIYKVRPSIGEFKPWSVSNRPAGLHVTTSSTLLVAFPDEHKIVEFETNGTQLREISLQSTDTGPMDVIQINCSHYVVTIRSSDNKTRTVCKVDTTGRVQESDMTLSVNESRRSYKPNRLAVDGDGYIFLSDPDKNRVLFSNQSLKFIREMDITERITPAICLNGGRMFAGISGQLCVYKVKDDLFMTK